MEYNTFEEWKSEVDRELSAICGLSGDDLADAPYYDHYEGGTDPKDMAEIVLTEYNDFPMEFEL